MVNVSHRRKERAVAIDEVVSACSQWPSIRKRIGPANFTHWLTNIFHGLNFMASTKRLSDSRELRGFLPTLLSNTNPLLTDLNDFSRMRH